MPELPEVEHLRRTLEPALLGAMVERAELRRRDVLRGAVAVGEAMLVGGRIASLDRRGKELAIRCEDGRVLCVHLGMSGQLVLESPVAPTLPATHRHAEWGLRGRDERLFFRDPRRFGGLVALRDGEALRTRWLGRGPDAFATRPAVVSSTLAAQGGRRAPIKAVLLDQRVLAGIGNIYADESLFRAGVRPDRPARSLSLEEWKALASALRRVLADAVASGGSSLRDYRDGSGRSGSYQRLHLVYGRGEEPCPRCGRTLRSGRVAGRTTTWCPRCQR